MMDSCRRGEAKEQGRGGTRSCSPCCPDCSGNDSTLDRSSRGCTSHRREARGSSLRTDPRGWSDCRRRNCRTSLGTTPRHCRSCRKCRARWASSGRPRVSCLRCSHHTTPRCLYRRLRCICSLCCRCRHARRTPTPPRSANGNSPPFPG